MSENLKAVIMYHRSYRCLPKTIKTFFWQFCILIGPLAAITILFYPEITRSICLITELILTPYIDEHVKIDEVEYIRAIGNISFIDLPGQYPSALFSIVNATICAVLLIVLPRIEDVKPVIILAIIVSAILFITALFFIIYPASFPYDAVDYSRLYMTQQISIWFFVPLLMGLAIIPLPADAMTKGFTLLITYLYSILFGTVRYIVFLFILAKISLLYMAILFFLFGPLIDFVYIVGFYGIYVASLTKKAKGDFNLWKWQ